MGTSEATALARPRTPAQKIAFCAGLTAAILTCVFLIGESATRAMGRRPWDPEAEQNRQTVEPGGRLMQPDAELGYVLCPGKFTVHLGRKLSFRVTNIDEYHRASRPEGTAPPPGAPGVWLFGDSFSYGWAVEDDDTYAWKIQAARPDLDVQNFSVGGYSTLQSLLELEAALERTEAPPKVVTLAYSSFHDGRNAMLRGNRKVWSASLERSRVFPVAWMEGRKLEYGLKSLDYTPWPLERSSAFVNFLEENYNRSQVVTSHAERISRALIQRFESVATAHGATFVLLGIFPNARTAEMLQWAKTQNISTIDISLDYSLPENITAADMHPSGHAHSIFAERIEPMLPPRSAIGLGEVGAAGPN